MKILQLIQKSQLRKADVFTSQVSEQRRLIVISASTDSLFAGTASVASFDGSFVPACPPLKKSLPKSRALAFALYVRAKDLSEQLFYFEVSAASFDGSFVPSGLHTSTTLDFGYFLLG